MADRPAPRKPNRKPAKAPTAAPAKAPAPKPQPTAAAAPKPAPPTARTATPATAAQPAATAEAPPKSRLIARIGAMLGGKANDGPRQFLQGRLTYLGVLLTAAGTVGKLFGWYVPVDEIRGAIDFIQAQWPTIVEFVGMLTTIYGRIRIGRR